MAERRDFVLLNEKYCFGPENDHPLLGRICSDANEPNRNYFPPDPSPYYSKDAQPIRIEAEGLEMTVKQSKTTTAAINLDKIFKILRKRQEDRASNWQAQRVRNFSLPQEDEVLSNLLKDGALHAKINDWLANMDSVYIIVGYMSMVNAHFSNDNSQRMSTEVEASLTRVIEAAIQAAGGAPLSLPELVVALSKASELSTCWKATYAEETVVAVKYRQIAKKWKLKSWLLENKIEIRNAQLAGGNTFGSSGTADSELQYWQAIKDKDLDDTEEEEVCFSPAEEILINTDSSRNVHAQV